MANRDGHRKSRNQASRRRIPELGYYLIVTDTDETESNYMYGLRDSMPEDVKRKLVIVVHKASTEELISTVKTEVSLQPQYREPWIVLDKDRVKGFDRIISLAEEADIQVGWSNPCIEIWFGAYFGAMPAYLDSTACCKGFSRKYERATKQEYDKADPAIYTKLCHFGNEENAIRVAQMKHSEQKRNCAKPSDMCPCTTVYKLVGEIREKTKNRV